MPLYSQWIITSWFTNHLFGAKPIRRQAITWTSAGLLSVELLGTNFSEIWIKIQIFIQENAIENVVCQIVCHFVQGIWVKQGIISAHGWGTPFRREVYRCDFCNGFVLTFVTVSMRPRQTAATHQLKMATAVTGIKKCYIIQLVTLHRYVCIPGIACRLHNIF